MKNGKIIVVLDSWFSYKASLEVDDNHKNIESLFASEYFDLKSPNTLRSILNAYVTRNCDFHAIDGSGYKYISKKIIEFDKLNPIVISRFLKIFSRFRNYSKPYKNNMYETLLNIRKNNLSTNTKEVIEAIIDI